MYRTFQMTCVLLVAVAPLTVRGADPASRFSLAAAVPGDAWMYHHTVHNPERTFLEKHWSHVWEAVHAANLGQDVKRMLMADLETEEDKAEFEAIWTEALGLIKQVDWDGLAKQERVIYCTRIVPVPDVTLLFSSEESSTDKNFEALTAIVTRIAELSDDLEIAEQNSLGAAIVTMPLKDSPISLSVFKYGQVIGCTISAQTAQKALEMVMQPRVERSIVQQPRFVEAAKALPPAEDGLTFVDCKALMAGMRQAVGANSPPPAQTGPDGQQLADWRALIGKLLEAFDVVDYMLVSEQTDGLQTREYSLLQLSPTGIDKPFCKVFTKSQALDDPLKSIPQDALGFTAWSGIDCVAAYDFALNFISTYIPDGQTKLENWKQMQQAWDLNLREEFLSWIDGRVLSIQFEPAVKTMMATPDSVFMLKVKDEQQASQFLTRMVAMLTENQNQPMATVSDAADVNAPGFNHLVVPALAMMGVGKISYGTHQGWLFISTSATALNKCLATRSGQAPSFAENERFRKEGVSSNEPVVFASFTDMSNLPQELGAMLFSVQMMSSFIPPEPETRVLRTLLQMAGKLSGAAGKMNFTLSSSSICRFDGRAYKSELVKTYKPYVEQPSQVQTKQPQEDSSLDGL